MKTALISFLLLTGMHAQAALIEGQFYPNTCGDNILTSSIQPVLERNVSDVKMPLVQKVCHGATLNGGEMVETVRLVLAPGYEVSHYDFMVIRSHGSFSNRSYLQKELIISENPVVGVMEFDAVKSGTDVISITVHPSSQSNLALTVKSNVMNKVANITSISQEM
mgnify:CR=1 FL=1